MVNPVVKATSYCLIHAPDMVLTHGTTATLEQAKNPESEFLRNLADNLRSFSQALAYPPNQCYIGNLSPEQLAKIPRPWYNNHVEPTRAGRLGEIMPLDEFIGLMKIVDSFNLVYLESQFAQEVKDKLASNVLIDQQELDVLDDAHPYDEITSLIAKKTSDPLTYQGKIVGCVRQAHESDASLSAHVIFENLVAKASSSLALKHLLWQNKIDPGEVDYIIETSEEACGDMNQRGGGNFAKAIGEACHCVNATGSDTRAFCAGPAHGIVNAAALVKSGIYKKVVVLGGGAVAKLGMNSRDHLKKNVPILEDMLGSFAILISDDDYQSPIINTEAIGRHRVGSGASPQAVTSALVTDPLKCLGLNVTDIDKYSVEMQNPEITVPAGAGDVPLANYKMIAALGVKQGMLARSELLDFVTAHGMTGWAPTQGHIPSGVPYIGFAKAGIEKGLIKRTMIIGKGSLFLARMTNLFDGVSFIMEPNPGEQKCPSEPTRRVIRIGVTLLGSEHGIEEMVQGAKLAQATHEVQVICIGPKNDSGLPTTQAETEIEQHQVMERLLNTGELDACVTMHYNFPLGVTTIGRVVAPATGKQMLIAATTGMAGGNRVEAMTKNAILGLATAKALGITQPTLGLLNVDGVRAVERSLLKLQESGYRMHWAKSGRTDGGAIMRGNDVLTGSCDVLVTDALTGNILMKMLSSLTTGGHLETTGYGYGPGVGENVDNIICILSRASGAPVVANAIRYASELAKASLPKVVTTELERTSKAGLHLSKECSKVNMPPAKKVTHEISGIDVLEIEQAAQTLWNAGVYAETGMGCTGPVVLIAPEDNETVTELLIKQGYLK